MSALLGKPACAASQKGGYLLQLRERLLRPFEALRRELFTPSPLGFAQNTINGVSQLARAGVANERSLHERVVEGRREEGEKGYIQGLGDLLLEVGPDKQVGVRLLDAGGDGLGVVLDERLIGKGVGVEKEVLLQVLKVRACPRYLQADLAGQSVTEARRVGEVAEEGHVPSSQVLRHGQPSVPRQLRRAGELRPHGTLHPLRVQGAQLAGSPQDRPCTHGTDRGCRHVACGTRPGGTATPTRQLPGRGRRSPMLGGGDSGPLSKPPAGSGRSHRSR